VAPLILTLLLDPASQSRFDALRRAHFPPERNLLAAHVTLFHALPGDAEQQVRADLAELARRSPFPVGVTGLRSLGRGVAYVLESGELAALHRELAARWRDHLTTQDRQPLRAHVTVQNKVPPETARTLLGQLHEHFTPYEAQAEGLALWRYLGGPWEPVAAERFTGGARRTGGEGG
jgi:2'-5' RNA ligase